MSAPQKTFALFGHPVSHSLSPSIHRAAYDELGLRDHEYVALDCPDEASVRARFEALRRGDIAGANVTVPWKLLALALADERDPSARDTGAANVLVRSSASGRIVAHNTDVPALSDELARGVEHPRRALVIGNGGAALAAVAACRSLGAERIAVVARRFRGTDEAAWERSGEFRNLGAVVLGWPDDALRREALAHEASALDLVVQSTSDGMRGASDGTSVRDALPWAALPKSVFVYDVVYNPSVTPFVAAARGHGLAAESGLGMLVLQAARAVELWLGERPPFLPLRRAAERALAEKFG